MNTPPDFTPQHILGAFNGKFPQTPFYIYDEKILETLWQTFKNSFEGCALPVESRFPFKANNNPHVLKFYLENGAGADVVSGAELKLAIKAGFAPEKIIFSGVGKSNEELEYAANLGIGMICIESGSELARLEKICVAKKLHAKIAFRVNPNVDAKTHPYISTGLHDHKFGIDTDLALELYTQVIQSQHLQAHGLSMHIGSQIRDLSVYFEATKQILSFAEKLKSRGALLKVLDLGGGLGIDYKQPKVMADFKNYAEVFKAAAAQWGKLFGSEGCTLLSECGRALVAQCGFLVTHVVATKQGKKTNFAIVDASMTELIRPSLYQSEHAIFRVDAKAPQTPTQTWQFVGPVCESADVLIKEICFDDIREGEAFIFFCAGAYGYVMANHYNARAIPAEWWLNKKQHPVLSRQRREFLTEF